MVDNYGKVWYNGVMKVKGYTVMANPGNMMKANVSSQYTATSITKASGARELPQ